MVFFHNIQGTIKLKLQREEKDESWEDLRTLLSYTQKAGERLKDRKQWLLFVLYFRVSTLVKLTGRKQVIRLFVSSLTSVALFLKKKIITISYSRRIRIMVQSRFLSLNIFGVYSSLITETIVNFLVEIRGYWSQ